MSILGRIGELRKRHEKLSINKLEQECGLTRGSMARCTIHGLLLTAVSVSGTFFPSATLTILELVNSAIKSVLS